MDKEVMEKINQRLVKTKCTKIEVENGLLSIWFSLEGLQIGAAWRSIWRDEIIIVVDL